jgi:VWFA-related protein
MDLSLKTLDRLISYEAQQPGRKLVVWLSPGWPLLSGPNVILTNKEQAWIFNSAVELSQKMREARVTLYDVDPAGANEAGTMRVAYYKTFLKGLKYQKNAEGGNLGLQTLATQTGGKVLNSSNDLGSLFASCLQDAKPYYTISFEAPPADHADEFHSLEMKVDKPGLTARTRMGYYAQPYKEPRP